MNDLKKFLTSFQSPTNQHVNNNNDNNNNKVINATISTHSVSKVNSDKIHFEKIELLKRNSVIKLGDYILFEHQSPVDSFNSAYNTKSEAYFYWKKFDSKDHMKKLEAYYIMNDYTSVYKYKELLYDQESRTSHVYAIFEPHYGDLHFYMKEKKKLNEPEAKFIFKQCVEAVNDCHMNGIIVRDIKLKKFVFVNPERTKVVLANLEDCLILDEDTPNDFIKSQQGCPAYVSPEVLNSHPRISYSGRLSDSWSLGIVLFTLLLGRYPFHHPTITIMFAKIARGKFQIPPTSYLSIDAKILLRSLIRSRPNERLLPFEILKHNWLKQIDHIAYDKHQNMFRSQQLNNNSDSLFSPNNNFSFLNFNNSNYPKQQLGISLSAPSTTSFNSNEPNSKRIKLTCNNNNNDNMVSNDDGIVPLFENK